MGPKSEPASQIFQSLPAIIISSGLATMGTGGDAAGAVKGAVVGARMPLVHHMLKNYQGAVGNEDDD